MQTARREQIDEMRADTTYTLQNPLSGSVPHATPLLTSETAPPPGPQGAKTYRSIC